MDFNDSFSIRYDDLKKISIARVVTVPIAFVHIRAFLKFLKTQNASVVLISSVGIYQDVVKNELGMDIENIEISRDINLKKDFRSLWVLIKYFRKNQFDIIHSSTPKAGLLVAIAGLFCPRSIRIHTFTGQRWATLKGPFRLLIKFFDKLIIALNKQCYADSPSQIEFLKKEHVTKNDRVKCLHKGSYGGIDCKRFDNERFPDARKELENELQINENSVIVLFVGRVTRDKGIEELVQAFVLACEQNTNIQLVIVGPFEPELDSIDPLVLDIIRAHASIHQLGFKPDPERYFSGSDIFCLPSYREGFGTVVLEAAACSIPTIGSRIPGLIDSIVDGETGILVELKNIEQLKWAILSLAADRTKRKQLGINAKRRAREDFDSDFMARVQWEEYLNLLKINS